MKKTRTFSERFWEKVVVASPDECWIWNAAKRKSPIGGGKYLFYGHLKAGVTAGGPGKMILHTELHGNFATDLSQTDI